MESRKAKQKEFQLMKGQGKFSPEEFDREELQKLGESLLRLRIKMRNEKKELTKYEVFFGSYVIQTGMFIGCVIDALELIISPKTEYGCITDKYYEYSAEMQKNK